MKVSLSSGFADTYWVLFFSLQVAPLPPHTHTHTPPPLKVTCGQWHKILFMRSFFSHSVLQWSLLTKPNPVEVDKKSTLWFPLFSSVMQHISQSSFISLVYFVKQLHNCYRNRTGMGYYIYWNNLAINFKWSLCSNLLHIIELFKCLWTFYMQYWSELDQSEVNCIHGVSVAFWDQLNTSMSQ